MTSVMKKIVRTGFFMGLVVLASPSFSAECSRFTVVLEASKHFCEHFNVQVEYLDCATGALQKKPQNCLSVPTREYSASDGKISIGSRGSLDLNSTTNLIRDVELTNGMKIVCSRKSGPGRSARVKENCQKL